MRDPDQKRGLYGKYFVQRLRPEDQGEPLVLCRGHSLDPVLSIPKHGACPLFVLDLVHDVHARAALAAYADSCRAEYPLLAADLWKQLLETSDAHRVALQQTDRPAEASAERAA